MRWGRRGAPHLGQVRTLGFSSFQTLLRLLSRRALDTFAFGTAILYDTSYFSPFGRLTQSCCSNSLANTAIRGSTSGLQSQGPSFRSLPQRKQRPLQSSLQRLLLSMP